jgi:hypothetical protein
MIFNGTDKIIELEASDGLSVNVIDIYSRWKDWILLGNAQFPQAMSSVGGDPITVILSLGGTFFMENGWKIKPKEADHELEIIGNIYTRDGSNPMIPTVGSYRVLVTNRVSNLIDTVSTGGSSLTAAQIWAYSKALTVGKFIALK